MCILFDFIVAIPSWNWSTQRQGCLSNRGGWRSHGRRWHSRERIFVGRFRLWPAWFAFDARSAHWHRGLSVLADAAPHRFAPKYTRGADCVRRCAHCCFNERGEVVLVGWGWLRTARSPGYELDAQRRGRVPLSTTTKTHCGTQITRSQGSVLWEGSHGCRALKRTSIFVGSRCLRSAGSPWHEQFPCWRRRISLSTHSSLCHRKCCF